MQEGLGGQEPSTLWVRVGEEGEDTGCQGGGGAGQGQAGGLQLLAGAGGGAVAPPTGQVGALGEQELSYLLPINAFQQS